MTDLMIQHRSSVTQMRQVDDHFLMVAGLENSVLPKDCSHLIIACHVRPPIRQ